MIGTTEAHVTQYSSPATGYTVWTYLFVSASLSLTVLIRREISDAGHLGQAVME